MTDVEAPLIITCDADEAEQLVQALRAAGLEVHASERRNLDGAAASEWIIAAVAVVQAMPRVIQALQPFFDRRRISQVKFGDVVLKDVQPGDAAKLIELIRGQAEKNG